MPQRMVSLPTCRVLAQWEVLRYSSGATQDMFQLGGWLLLVYHQMEYQQWVPGPQTLLTLCAMVRYKTGTRVIRLLLGLSFMVVMQDTERCVVHLINITICVCLHTQLHIAQLACFNMMLHETLSLVTNVFQPVLLFVSAQNLFKWPIGHCANTLDVLNDTILWGIRRPTVDWGEKSTVWWYIETEETDQPSPCPKLLLCKVLHKG